MRWFIFFFSISLMGFGMKNEVVYLWDNGYLVISIITLFFDLVAMYLTGKAILKYYKTSS